MACDEEKPAGELRGESCPAGLNRAEDASTEESGVNVETEKLLSRLSSSAIQVVFHVSRWKMLKHLAS